MLIDELDRTARERLGAILERVEGLGIALDEKNALMGYLLGVKDFLGGLDVQGLQHVNEVLHQVLGMFLHFQSLEPITGLLLSLLKFLGGGQEQELEEEHRPGRGMEAGR